MKSRITRHENKILAITGDNLVLPTKKVLRHSCEFALVLSSYIVDSQKNIFSICLKTSTLSKIGTLKRNPSQIKEISPGKLIISDFFGDFYQIYDNKAIYLFGNMCYVTCFAFVEGLIYSGDKYGRIRITEIDGKIKNVIFIEKSPIISILHVGQQLVVLIRHQIILINLSDLKPIHIPAQEDFFQIKEVGASQFLGISANLLTLYHIENSHLESIKTIKFDTEIIDAEFLHGDFYALTKSNEIFRNTEILKIKINHDL